MFAKRLDGSILKKNSIYFCKIKIIKANNNPKNIETKDSSSFLKIL